MQPTMIKVPLNHAGQSVAVLFVYPNKFIKAKNQVDTKLVYLFLRIYKFVKNKLTKFCIFVSTNLLIR